MWLQVQPTVIGMCCGDCHFWNCPFLFAEYNLRMSILGIFQTYFTCTPSMLEALWLDVFVPGIVKGTIEMTVIHFLLK
jgi:hypothetical protein